MKTIFTYFCRIWNPHLSCFLCLTTPGFCLISPLKQSYRASYSGVHEAKVHSIITSLKYGKLCSLYLSCQCQLSLSQPVWYFVFPYLYFSCFFRGFFLNLRLQFYLLPSFITFLSLVLYWILLATHYATSNRKLNSNWFKYKGDLLAQVVRRGENGLLVVSPGFSYYQRPIQL